MQPESSGFQLTQLVPIVLMGLVFYFIVFLPEKKRKQERANQLAKLQKNDPVITAGGIHGTIVNVKTDTVIVRVDDNVKIEVDREAISTVKKS